MSQRTDIPSVDERPEFTNAYLASLVSATVVVLVLIFIVAPMVGNPLNAFRIHSSPMPWLYAWVLAGGQTIANALAEFSGQIPEPVEATIRYAALTSLLLVGVISPTLFLLLMQTSTARSVPSVRRGVYLLGFIITGTFAITVLPAGYVAHRVTVNLREAQAVQENKDEIINDLNAIAGKAHEYVVLPTRLSGGEGSLEGFTVPFSVSQSAHAAYAIRPDGGKVIVEAMSKMYEGAKVTISIDDHGQMGDWSYSGRFE